jgi:hypothetical protein
MLVLSKETLFLSPLMIPASPGLQFVSGLLATADHVKSSRKNYEINQKWFMKSLTNNVESYNGTLK